MRAGANPRLLGTHEFLNQIVKAGGKESKHEISAFHQRWIIGRGCPLLTAAVVFHRCTRGSNLNHQHAEYEGDDRRIMCLGLHPAGSLTYLTIFSLS